MCDCTRVDRPIQGSQAAQTVNHGHSDNVNTKPAQVPERYRTFNPLGVQKDAGFSRFTPMPTDMAFDNVSLAAKGLFFQLNTLPPDWNYTAKGMATICGCGVDKISSLMKELEAAHRVIRLRYRNDKGQLSAMVPMIVSEPDRIDEAIEKARQRGFEIDPKIARANLRGSVENLDRPLSQPIVENSTENKSCGKPSEHIPSKPQVTPSTGFSSTGSASTGFSVSILNSINTKNSTTTPTESDSQLEQGGTAHAAPVVSSPTAPSSVVDLDLREKNEEAPLVRDSIDAAFFALEARSLRRTGSPARKEAARLSYRRLVNEGHSPDDINAVYDHYLRWVESEKAQNIMGLPSFFERKNGWKLNYTQLMNEQTKTKSSTQTGAPEAGKLADDADYRRRSAAVKSTLPDSDAECAYLFAYADSSDDQHLHDVAAKIRREGPIQYSNGYIDDRLSRRPSYPVLVRLVHSREHLRQYNETTYSALVAEGKIRG